MVQTLTWQEFSRRSEEAADRFLSMIQNFNKEFPDPDGKEPLRPLDESARSEYVTTFRSLLAKHYSIGPAPHVMAANALTGAAPGAIGDPVDMAAGGAIGAAAGGADKGGSDAADEATDSGSAAKSKVYTVGDDTRNKAVLRVGSAITRWAMGTAVGHATAATAEGDDQVGAEVDAAGDTIGEAVGGSVGAVVGAGIDGAGGAAADAAEDDDDQVRTGGGAAGGAVAGGIVGAAVSGPIGAAADAVIGGAGGAAADERGEEEITDETDTMTYRIDVNRGY